MALAIRWIRNALCKLLLILALPTGLTEAKAEGNEDSTHCLIRIEGTIFDTLPCDMNTDSNGVITFGHLDELNGAGYWVYLIHNEDGSLAGFWNDEYGAARAHSHLGTLNRVDQGVGECFSGDSVLLCRDIPANTPLYYVETREDLQGKRILLAYVDGLEYQLTHPAWENDEPLAVMDRADFDGDDRLDALISTNNGGNCCPNNISVVSYRGDGFFTFLDDQPLSGGWGGHEVVTEQGRTIIRIHDTPIGSGNISRHRGQRDYAFSVGRLELIAERLEHSSPTEVVGLTLEDVKFADGGQKTLSFDINNDGAQDEINCSYWERWGVLNCTAVISGVEKPVELQCNHVSMSPVVIGLDRSHRLVCDGNVVEY